MRHLAGNADFLVLPRWRGLLSVTYTSGGLTAGLQQRLIGGYDRSALQFYSGTLGKIRPIYYTDINLSYKMPVRSTEVELFTVVNNLFDQRPPLAPGTVGAFAFGVPFAIETYDTLGTYVTVGARLKF